MLFSLSDQTLLTKLLVFTKAVKDAKKKAKLEERQRLKAEKAAEREQLFTCRDAKYGKVTKLSDV
eukprot:scaffold38557_cov228-Skeletonema_dohrnii-CCMP3373.AAC.2